MSAGTSYVCVLVKLPNKLVRSLRRLTLPFSIYELKLRLELLVGLPTSCFSLCCPGICGGQAIKNEFIFNSSDFSNENSTLLFTVLLPADISKLYETLSSLLSQNSSQYVTGAGSVSVHVPAGSEFAALFLSSYLGWIPLCKHLIAENDGILSGRSEGRNTALHAACMRDRVDVVSLLAYSGVQIGERNCQGKTSLETALEAGAMSCYRRLKQIKIEFHREATEVQLTDEGSESSSDEKQQDAEPPEESKPSSAVHGHVNSRQEIIKNYMSSVARRSATNKSRAASSKSVNTKTPAKSAKPADPLLTRVLSARQRTRFNYKPADPENASNQRRIRLCRQQPNMAHNRCMSAPADTNKESLEIGRKRFKVTRPQYLQYIKSSTGIIEEDYFADIFPGVEDDQVSSSEEEEGSRMHTELARRKRRIFRKMLKDSALIHSSDTDGTDSEEELVRQTINQKAFRRWIQHKEQEKREAERKKCTSVQLPSDSRTQLQSLTPLIMVGDTWSTDTVTSERAPAADGYMLAYREYKRAKSAPVQDQGRNGAYQLNIDPLTYNRWLDTKMENGQTAKLNVTFADDSRRFNPNLIKKIQYEDWLASSNAKLHKELHRRNKEKKYAVEFEKWITDLKKEVDTFNYWKRNKEQQLSSQYKQQKKKQQLEERRKTADREKREEMSSQIYKNWLSQKERGHLDAERSKLSRERQKQHK